MPKLVDMHNHALFGVDDGAQTLADAMDMIAVSYAEGVRVLCLTPHADPVRFRCEAETVEAHYREIQALCHEKFPDLSLYRGNELYGYQGCLELLVAGKYCPLGNGRSVLVEFALDVTYLEMYNFFLSCRGVGYYPVLAHAERYECLANNIDRVCELAHMRIMIQVNASSVLRRLVATPWMRAARRMMEAGVVDMIASDAHGVKSRSSQLLQAYCMVAKQYGAARANRLFYETPQRLLAGEKERNAYEQSV